MEEEFKDLEAMELPELLKHILINARSIQSEVKNFNQSKESIIEQVRTTSLGLEEKAKEIENLSSAVSKNIVDSYKKQQFESKQIFEARLEEFKSIPFNLSERDRKQIQKAETTFQKWWKLPVILVVCSLLITLLTSFLAVKFYKESVKSKQELKQDIAKEMQQKNLIWIEKGEWDKAKEEKDLVKMWSEKNPKDSKSLESFIKGYESFKKERK